MNAAGLVGMNGNREFVSVIESEGCLTIEERVMVEFFGGLKKLMDYEEDRTVSVKKFDKLLTFCPCSGEVV